MSFPAEIQRHSCSHLLATAVKEIFPDAKFGIGPDIAHGFYYDFDLSRTITPDDLKQIYKKMCHIQKQNALFQHFETPIDDAIKKMKKEGQIYKVELAQELKGQGEKTLSFFQNGEFIDMCAGPHVQKMSDIGPFKLTSVAGVYWKSDKSRQMLQRIYGICFSTKKELDEHEKMLEEAKKRDHRVLGKKLDLFTFSEKVGSGLPLFTPKGALMRNLIVEKLQEIQKPYGYNPVWIPHITKKDLYEVSGHWKKFKEDLFHVKGKGDTEFVMKPMNCPHHTQIFDSNARSYRDLPQRYAEVTTNYRDEQPGELLGLSRVRSLTQDDAHVFCTLEQAQEEAQNMVKIIREFYTLLGMFRQETYWVSLSVRDEKTPEKYLGKSSNWDEAERLLEKIAKEEKLSYKRVEGEAAFYGPKLDFMFRDSLGREWQLATIQIDFVMPERFKLTYTDKDGAGKIPVMIHRAIAGSLERFLSVVIEHFAGHFPLWLAPIQIVVLPVAEAFESYADKVMKLLLTEGFRVEILDASHSLGKRVRNVEKQKIPVVVVLGEQEQNEGTITIRNEEHSLQIEEFIQRMKQEVGG